METNQSPFKKVTHFEFGQHYKTANNHIQALPSSIGNDVILKHCTTIDINLSKCPLENEGEKTYTFEIGQQFKTPNTHLITPPLP